MKKYRILEILYPIGIYYLISGFVFFALNMLLGEAPEIYMVKQLISSGAVIPFLLSLYKQDHSAEKIVYGQRKFNGKEMAEQAVLTIVAAVFCGMALNNFIAMTPLIKISAGFETANEHFFAGKLLMEILASCVVVPIAEELLFRGIVLKRAVMLSGEKIGVLCSALLFGIIHMNLVQFLYAALLGGLLAIIVVKTKHIELAVLGHAAANLAAIIRAETGWLDFSYQVNATGIAFSAGMLLIGLWAAWKLCENKKFSKVQLNS